MLPEGWAETTIGDVAETKLGKMLDAAKNKGEPVAYLRNINVRWGAFDLSDLSEMRVTPTERENLSVRDGDLFVCEGGEPGRCAVWRGAESKLIFQKAIHRVRSAGGVEPDFLARHIAHAAAMDRLSHLFTGTTIKHLPQVALQRLHLPLPPLAEQRRIVAKLDALTAHLARARAELERVEQLATQLRSAALAEAFEATSVAVVSVSTIVSDVRYGTAKKCAYGQGEVPVLRIPNVQAGTINLSDLKTADFDNKERSKLALATGDILVIRSNGSVSLVGRSAVVDQFAEGMLYAGYLIRLRVKQDLCLPDYLHLFLQSGIARRSIQNAARSTSGVHNVNAEQLKALRLPVPNLAVQKMIVSHLTTAFARADRLEAEAARARALLDRLEAAILAKAFRGELVPQNAADEPASVLLDRIRAERAAAPKLKRGRRAATKKGI